MPALQQGILTAGVGSGLKVSPGAIVVAKPGPGVEEFAAFATSAEGVSITRKMGLYPW